MINVSCFCFGYPGIKQHGRNFVAALGRFDEIALFPLDDVPPLRTLSPFVQNSLRNATGPVKGNVGLGIGVVNRMAHIVGKKKIAFIIWETSNIPPNELQLLGKIDEIWTPSTWGKNILTQNGVAANKVKIVPEGVDVNRYKPKKTDNSTKKHRPFRFLCVGKWEQRKGIDILLQAYAKAFKPNEAVELVLHCHNPFIDHFSIEAAVYRLKLPSHAPIRTSYPVSEAALVDIINDCDAFVLASRGEGWGLPIIEAMACAKPVIVTDYGGYRDFVNAENAYLILVKKMVDVDDPIFFDPNTD